MPVTPWNEHVRDARWRQGDHVAIVAPTGAGKSVLGTAIARSRDSVVAVTPKRADPIMAETGWPVRRKWSEVRLGRQWVMPSGRYGRRHDLRSSAVTEAAVLSDVAAGVWREGGWCLYVDETYWLSELLGPVPLRSLMMMGRSEGVTVIASTQRPAHVPTVVWDQSTHVYIGQTFDRAVISRAAALGRAPDSEIRSAIAGLGRYEWVWLSPSGLDVITSRGALVNRA